MSFTIACGPTPGELIIISIFIILIPTIIIETILLKNILKKKWGESFLFCSIANTASFVTGIIIGISSSIIANSFGNIVNILCWILTLPIIIWMENAIYKRPWNDIPKKKLLKAVITVNIITFAIISTFIYIMPGNHSRTREIARQISCLSNLRGIGLSLIQYSMDYNGYFPNKSGVKGFEQLRTNDYLTDYGVYLCPSSDTPKGKDNQKLTNETVDYIYQSGLKDSEDSDKSKIPLAWDKPKNHEDYGNVVFLDGHIKGFKGADWMEQAGIK